MPGRPGNLPMMMREPRRGVNGSESSVPVTVTCVHNVLARRVEKIKKMYSSL